LTTGFAGLEVEVRLLVVESLFILCGTADAAEVEKLGSIPGL
jgi:hypothetical protein